ncbi:MAG: lipoyl synthase [bacterium]
MGHIPQWIRVGALSPRDSEKLRTLLDSSSLHTVCEEASCPNIKECFSNGTSTFLILGQICTRECRFCGIRKGVPLPINPKEADDIALAVHRLDLDYVVITSVARDDLPCGGARHFARTISAIRSAMPKSLIEVLIPDFNGNEIALESIIAERPAVINHNLETVPRVFPHIRRGADYCRSLQLLSHIKMKDSGILTKSGIMLGLGETIKEVIHCLHDLRSVGCDILTLSQYLQPSPRQVNVARYVAPEMFSYLKTIAFNFGFKAVASGPLIRSSYKALHMYRRAHCQD